MRRVEITPAHQLFGTKRELSRSIQRTVQLVINAGSYRLEVNRPAFLSKLYADVTTGTIGARAQIEAVNKFVQGHMFPPHHAPVDTEGNMLMDPVLLHDLGIGGCGQTNRLLVDLLNAGGHQARLLQLSGHVAAAVWLDGAWRFLDADTLSFGLVIENARGEIATVEELFDDPDLVRNVQVYVELDGFMRETTGQGYSELGDVIGTFGDLDVFQRQKIAGLGTTPFFYVKDEDATGFTLRNKFFGWNYFKVVPMHPGEPGSP